MKNLKDMTTEEFNEAIEKIEQYKKTDEYTEKLRDTGEEIMRILIDDNQKAGMNLSCCIRIIERMKDPSFESPRSEEEQERIKKDYAAGEKTLKVMKQVKELFNKINKVYYNK